MMYTRYAQFLFVGQGCGGTEALLHCWWESEMEQLLWNIGNSSKKLNIQLPYGPKDTYTQEDIQSIEMSMYVAMKTCMQIFTGVLFTIKVKKA